LYHDTGSNEKKTKKVQHTFRTRFGVPRNATYIEKALTFSFPFWGYGVYARKISFFPWLENNFYFSISFFKFQISFFPWLENNFNFSISFFKFQISFFPWLENNFNFSISFFKFQTSFFPWQKNNFNFSTKQCPSLLEVSLQQGQAALIHAFPKSQCPWTSCFWRGVYRVSQELRSLVRDLIPELILSQKRHIHMGPIRNGSGVMSF